MALLEVLKWAGAMEEDVMKSIFEAEERHRVNKESLKRRMEAEWREIFEDEKERMGAAVEKQPLSF